MFWVFNIVESLFKRRNKKAIIQFVKNVGYKGKHSKIVEFELVNTNYEMTGEEGLQNYWYLEKK